MTQNGIIKSIFGTVVARTSDGQESQLNVGDIVYENEILEVASNSHITIESNDGKIIDLTENSQVNIYETKTGSFATREVDKTDVENLQKALADGEDITEEEVAAGTEEDGYNYNLSNYEGDQAKGEVGSYLLGTEYSTPDEPTPEDTDEPTPEDTDEPTPEDTVEFEPEVEYTDAFTVTLMGEGTAGYHNSYGFYIMEDGKPVSGELFWSDVHVEGERYARDHQHDGDNEPKMAEIGDSFIVEGVEQADIGFFIIPNGGKHSTVRDAILDKGEITFEEDGDHFNILINGVELTRISGGGRPLFDNPEFHGETDETALTDNEYSGNQNWDDQRSSRDDDDFNDVNIQVDWEIDTTPVTGYITITGKDSSYTIDSETGYNTLIINDNNSLDFSNINTIQKIDLSDSETQEITLDINQVLELVGNGNTLTFSGDSGDVVKFNDDDGKDDNWNSTINSDGSITFEDTTANLSFIAVPDDNVDIKATIDIDI